MTTSATRATARAMSTVDALGYEIVESDPPAIRCATVRGDVYSAPDWASLAHYARTYALCECGAHHMG